MRKFSFCCFLFIVVGLTSSAFAQEEICFDPTDLSEVQVDIRFGYCEEINDHSEQVDRYEEDIDSTNREINTTDAQLDIHRRAIDDLRQQRRGVGCDSQCRDRIDEQINDLDQEIDQLEERMNALEERLTQLETDLAEIEERLNELAEMFAELQVAVDEILVVIEDFRVRIGNLETRVSDVEMELVSLSSEVDRATATAEAAQEVATDVEIRQAENESVFTAGSVGFLTGDTRGGAEGDGTIAGSLMNVELRLPLHQFTHSGSIAFIGGGGTGWNHSDDNKHMSRLRLGVLWRIDSRFEFVTDWQRLVDHGTAVEGNAWSFFTAGLGGRMSLDRNQRFFFEGNISAAWNVTEAYATGMLTAGISFDPVRVFTRRNRLEEQRLRIANSDVDDD